MKRGDFKDRIKNYTEEPLDSDWSKMAQLLDMNEKKKRRPFFWKLLGGAMLIGAVVGSVLFFKVVDSPVILPQNEISSSSLAADNSVIERDLSANATLTNEEQEIDLDEKESVSIDESKVAEQVTEIENENETTSNNLNQSNKPSVIFPTQERISRPYNTVEVKNNPLQINNSNLENNLQLSRIEIIDAKEKDQKKLFVRADLEAPIVGLSNLAFLQPNMVNSLEAPTEKEIFLSFAEKPEVKILKSASNYLCVGLKASFPEVGLMENADSFLAPNQKLIPNLGIELGVGRKWDSGLSLELGLRTSYFQYRLSNVVNSRLVADPMAINEDEFQLSKDVVKINRHLIFSPYLRLAYDWPISKNSFVGVFGAVGPNFIYDLPSTDVEGSASLNQSNTIGNESTFSFSDFSESKNSYEAEFGLTLGQKVLGSSQLTLHFSYAIIYPNLLSGTVFLEKDNQRINSDIYEIKDNGPRFKVRYYFGAKK